MNDTTKRFHRDMQSAFGPYTSNEIWTPVEKTPAHEWALYLVSVLAVIVFLAVL